VQASCDGKTSIVFYSPTPGVGASSSYHLPPPHNRDELEVSSTDCRIAKFARCAPEPRVV